MHSNKCDQALGTVKKTDNNTSWTAWTYSVNCMVSSLLLEIVFPQYIPLLASFQQVWSVVNSPLFRRFLKQTTWGKKCTVALWICQSLYTWWSSPVQWWSPTHLVLSSFWSWCTNQELLTNTHLLPLFPPKMSNLVNMYVCRTHLVSKWHSANSFHTVHKATWQCSARPTGFQCPSTVHSRSVCCHGGVWSVVWRTATPL